MGYEPRSKREAYLEKLHQQAKSGSYEDRLKAKIKIARVQLNRAEWALIFHQELLDRSAYHAKLIEDNELPF